MLFRSIPSTATFGPLLAPGGIPTLVSILITISAVLSLVTIISIYREGGILKRLRATPLRPWTILTAHVLVKLALTAYVPAFVGAVELPGGVYVKAKVPETLAPPTPVAVAVAACALPS